MNTKSEQQSQQTKTTLSTVGAVIYAALATVLSVMCSASLQNSAEQAVLSVLAPVFLFAAGYFSCILAVHRQKLLFFICAAASVLCSFAFTFDIFRSLVCIGAFGAAFFVSWACERPRVTHAGAICGALAIYAVALLWGFLVLCYQKFGAVNTDTAYRAFESFCNVIMKQPEATLSSMIDKFGSQKEYESLISEYQASIKALRETLALTVYVIPSTFLYICAAGGFITVRSAVTHRRMQSLPDNLGMFSVSIVTAVVYLILYLVSIFTDPTTPLGITINTVSTLPSLGLALFGFLYLFAVIKLHPKRRMYTTFFVLVIVFFTSMALSLLSIVGAYNTIKFYLIQKKRNNQNNDNTRR